MSKRQPSSRSCFVCGRENPVSLKMKWDQDAETGEIRATVTLPDHFNGYPGVAHGGVVAAVLDETAGRSILVDGGFEELMVTAKLEVVYRRPTPTGVPLTAVGRLVRRDGDRAEAQGELRLPDGTVYGPRHGPARASAAADQGRLGPRARALASRPGLTHPEVWGPPAVPPAGCLRGGTPQIKKKQRASGGTPGAARTLLHLSADRQATAV